MLGLAFGLHWSPKLGLDLEGGLSVVYQPNKKVNNATLQNVTNIIQQRINALGVSQPNVTTQGDNVVVQLPGVKDPAKILPIIGETAQLFIRPVLCYAPAYVAPKKKSAAPTGPPPTCPTQYQESISTYNASTGNNAPPAVYAPYASYPTATPSTDNPTQNVIVPISSNAPASDPRYVLGPSMINGQIVTGTIIKSAYSQFQTNLNEWAVVFNLTSKGSALFDAIATKYYHTQVADDLDGVVESAPIINAQTFGGTGEITGNFDQASANALALQLNYGALPVGLTKLTSTIVSPTLGKSSLHAGLIAGLIGLLLVLLYTIVYYRALGIVVFLGLVTTGAFLYGLISALGASSFGLTLDLSGVTGLIVSVGITVDSYVVYFERLKDEVRAGRSVRAAVDRGFRSAYRTILSADAVSLIGALVLWVLSVGAVRGFAFMLGLSTLVDVVTAYVFTRPLVILLGRNRIFTEARHLGVARGLARGAVTP
jgi:preprotein translocase subunit SecD